MSRREIKTSIQDAFVKKPTVRALHSVAVSCGEGSPCQGAWQLSLFDFFAGAIIIRYFTNRLARFFGYRP